MKRPPPNFVVEVRRQRRSTNSGAKAWLTEPTLSGAASASERHLGATALFEAERKAPTAAETTPSRPQGRILPSLADVEPIAASLDEAAAPPRRKRESFAPTAKPKTRTKKEPGRKFAPPQRSAAPALDSAGAPPPLRSLEEPSVEFRTGASRTPAGARRKAKTPSPGAKSMREAAAGQVLASALAARAMVAAKTAAVPAERPSPENATADRGEARQARHRRIMDRYVLGAELKPGERWKRRTQDARK